MNTARVFGHEYLQVRAQIRRRQSSQDGRCGDGDLLLILLELVMAAGGGGGGGHDPPEPDALHSRRPPSHLSSPHLHPALVSHPPSLSL